MMFQNDPYFFNGHVVGVDKIVPPVLQPPPVKNLWVTYGRYPEAQQPVFSCLTGINLPTEVSYYYRCAGEGELVLDSTADRYSQKVSEANPRGYKVKGGIA